MCIRDSPEPFALSKNLEYTELGEHKITDFSGKNETSKELKYTDYMIAHTTNKLHPPTKSTPNKSIDDIESERSSVRYVMNDTEIQKYERYKQNLRAKEERRVINLKNQDKEIELMFHKVNKSMLKYK